MDERGARELARALLQGQDEGACASCLDQLEAYVEAQLGGRPYAALFPAVARHLDGCVACAEAYGLLYETLAAAAEPAEPARIPEPDLSFLGAGARPGEALRAALKDALSLAASGLRLTLTRPLLDLLAPGPSLGQALRGAGQAALLELSLDGPAPQVAQLQLGVYPAAADPEAGDLRVQVQLHGREWPDLGGVGVALSAGGLRREAVTDAWGEAVIEGVPLAALEGAQLEVRA